MNNELASAVFWSIMIMTGGFWWGCMYAEWRRKKGDKHMMIIKIPMRGNEGPELMAALSVMLREIRESKGEQ